VSLPQHKSFKQHGGPYQSREPMPVRVGNDALLVEGRGVSGLQVWTLVHHHLRADGHTIIQINHVIVDETKATRRDSVPYGLWLIGAVDSIYRLSEIKGSSAELVTRATRHEPRQIGLSGDHFWWWGPIRPLRFSRYTDQALPLEALTPNRCRSAERDCYLAQDTGSALRYSQ
jgi:hypothetical protein